MSDETTVNDIPEGAENNSPPEDINPDGYKALKDEASADERTFEVRDKTFRLADDIPAIVMLDLGLAADPEATQVEQIRAMRQFLKAAVHEDDAGSFEAFLRSARPVIDMEELNTVMEGLIATIGGRPTE